MKIVLIQAALLVGALGVAYQTWTREEAAPDSPGSTRLWTGQPEEVSSLAYVSDEVRTVVERRRDEAGSYLWATVTKIDGTAAAAPTNAADSTAASDRATADLVVAPADSSESSFLVGEQGERLTELAASPMAVRDLGVPDEERIEEYGLDDPEAHLTIVVGGTERTLEIGGQPWGSGDRYARDPASGRAYVLSAPLLRILSNAEMSLPERRLHDFENEVDRVTVRTAGGERTMRRVSAASGTPSWVPPDRSDAPDQTFANFMERVDRLWLQEFFPDQELEGLQHLVRIDYTDARGNEIGYLDLYRGEGEEGERAYFARTERSRVPAAVHPSIAEQIEQDVNTLF